LRGTTPCCLCGGSCGFLQACWRSWCSDSCSSQLKDFGLCSACSWDSNSFALMLLRTHTVSPNLQLGSSHKRELPVSRRGLSSCACLPLGLVALHAFTTKVPQHLGVEGVWGCQGFAVQPHWLCGSACPSLGSALTEFALACVGSYCTIL
jgi:hypothetical protein